MLWQYPSRSPIHQLLWNHSSCGSDRGITHFFMATRNTTERAGEKENKNKRTILAWVNSRCKKGSSVTLHSRCICRLTLTCIFREISTKIRGMQTHLDWFPSLLLDPFSCRLVSSAVRCQLPFCVTLRQLLLWIPFANHSLTGVPLPTSGCVEISSSGLCLASRQNKQKDCLLAAPPS